MRYCFAIVCLVCLFFLQNIAIACVPDSVGVKIIDGKRVIIHKIVAKETWYSISRQYGVDVKKLQAFNSNVKSLTTGEEIDIPTSFTHNSVTKGKDVASAKVTTQKQKEASKGQKSKSGTKKEQPKPQTGKKDNFFKRLFSKKE